MLTRFLSPLASAVALVAAISAAPVVAASIGQPLLVIDAAEGGAPTGSILDFFGPFGPSGQKDVTVSGTVTEAFGAPSTVGMSFRFDSSVFLGGASLTLGETMVDDSSLIASPDFFDPFVAGPGDLNFTLFFAPPFEEVPPFDPFGTFVYGGAFSDWPDRDANVFDFPEFEFGLSVFLDAPLPTRLFEDPDDPAFDFEFIEGPLSISRIEFGTVGGPPVAPVPLPAGLPLLLLGIAALGAAGRRR